MKIKWIAFISFAVLSLSATAQDNYGFYGKKTFVELSSSSHLPLIYNLTNLLDGSELTPSGLGLTPFNDWFNMGARVSIGRATKSDFGVALELGFDRYTLNDYVLVANQYSSDAPFDHESLKVNSLLIMPRFEISGQNGLLPNGLVHQVGFGVNVNSIVRKNYLVEYETYTTGGPKGDPEDEEELFKTYDLEGSVKMIQLMYGLKMRTPISKSLMINYGFRYTIDFPIATSLGFNTAVAREIGQFQFRSVIAFDLGLTVPF